MTWPYDESITFGGPLAGIRVLDLSRIIAGPLATLYLADLGADVIKIERPGSGDEMRGYGPEKWNGVGSTFLALNRNKRSVVLDLNAEADRNALREIVADADVLIESYRPGIMARWGLAFEELVKINPSIIHCSITGFGGQGPAANLGANNLIAEAFGGSMSVSIEASASRLSTGTPMTDYFTGTSAALAITAAIAGRSGGGEGTHIETSLLESQSIMMSGYIVGYLASGVDPSPEAGLAFTVPNQSFAAADHKFVLAANSEPMWQRMCQALEKTDWLENPEFATNAQRMQRQREIVDELDAIFADQPRDHWISLFSEYRVTVGPINTVGDLLAHPQVAQLDVLLPLESERIPGLTTVRTPFTYSGAGWKSADHRPPPELGQHTEAVRGALS